MCKMLTGLDILLTLRPSLITVPFAVVSFCARAKANSAELKSNRFIGMRVFFPEGSIGVSRLLALKPNGAAKSSGI